jgi:uncharacterized membrane protein YkgB
MSVSISPAARGLSVAKSAAVLERVSAVILRYGLVLIILWYGLFKFTPAEARAIEPLVRNSPLLSWLYGLLDVNGVSRVIGVTEIIIAVLIAARPLKPRLAAIGSLGAVGMFLTTLSFLVTTPGMFGVVDGMAVPHGGGGFIVKDLILLGAAMWSASESLQAPERG